MLIAQIAEPGVDGHTYHRVSGPAYAMSCVEGVTVIEVPPLHRAVSWVMDHADILILHTIDPDLTAVVPRRRNRGQVTILEASDHYFDVQPWSDYSLGWLDRGRQDQFWYTVATVDAVQTSTQFLAELWKAKARRVVVMPNAIPSVPPLLTRPSRPLTIGWAGSITHLADWFAIAPTVACWVAAHPSARLAVMGPELARDFVRLPSHQYAFTPLGTHEDYQRFLSTLDVAVVPLADTPFNRGRTDLKFWDLAAAGVVGVYEANGPYPHSIEHGVTGWLYSTPEELVGVLKLANDPIVREQAHARAMQRSSSEPANLRLETYREMLQAIPTSIAIPPAFEAFARTHGRDAHFANGECERIVSEAITSSDRSLLPKLAAILVEWPEYQPARRAMARIHLNHHQRNDAYAILEPMLANAAATPGLLADAAAASDASHAKLLLERALSLNPAFAGAWQSYLMLAPAQAERAAANLPCDYLAALRVAMSSKQLMAWLETYASTAHLEEKPYLVAAFAAVVRELPLEDEGRHTLLLRAADLFPESAAVADLLGRSFQKDGDVRGAAECFERAARLERIARGFALEFPPDPPERKLWAVGAAAHA